MSQFNSISLQKAYWVKTDHAKVDYENTNSLSLEILRTKIFSYERFSLQLARNNVNGSYDGYNRYSLTRACLPIYVKINK